MIDFKALCCDSITLHLINEDNLNEVFSMFAGYEDGNEMIVEISENYLPQYHNGKRINYGFYTTINDELAGMSLLGIHSWPEFKGYTGADTLLHMRGRGIAPRSKPHLFYLAFELLGLHRIETGCIKSNVASKKSIEKTLDFFLQEAIRSGDFSAE